MPGPKPITGPCTSCGRDDNSRRYANPVRCHTCYQRDRCRSKPKPKPAPMFGPVIPTLHLKGTSYSGAHQLVTRHRGPAKDYPCSAPGCSSQAAQWAFKPVSERWVQSGVQPHGRGKTMFVSWSGHISDYSPMCIPCHVQHDRELGAAR